jgi:hypothetical protein
MDAAVKAVELDATAQTHHMATEALVLQTLQDIIQRGMEANAAQTAQPGQPPQQAAPVGA